jgi:hypothetical protein
MNERTREVLEKIIRQEIENVQRERGLLKSPEEEEDLEEVNPGHDSEGKFAKKGKGTTYSLTKNAEDNPTAKNLEKPARGKITSKGKIASKFGMNTGDPDKNCGRMTMDGKPKKKTRSCKDYPKNYWNEEKEYSYKRKSPESDYIKKKKAKTKQKNKLRDKRDLIPREPDTPAVRREKIFPGTEDLWSLAHGIVKEKAAGEDGTFPYWDEDGKLRELGGQPPEAERQVETDDRYLQGLIRQAVSNGIDQARAEAAKQGQRYSWNQIMKLIGDLNRAEKGNPEDK